MPPAHGASIVADILDDAEMTNLWSDELSQMRVRISGLRSLLVEKLRDKGVNSDFTFIERERGMFSFLGISRDQVNRLKNEFSIYMVDSIRIKVAGSSHRNINYLVDSRDRVV